MLEELLRTDNLCIMILKKLPIFDIKSLMCTCKIFHKLICFSDIWRSKITKFDYENQIRNNRNNKKNIKMYDLIDIEIPCNFYIEFMKLYSIYGYVPNKVNFRLLIDGLPHSINKRLISTKVEKSYVLQSIRDIDWEYRIDSQKLKRNNNGTFYVDLLFCLIVNNNLLTKFGGRLTIHGNNGSKHYVTGNSEPLSSSLKLLNSPEGIKLDIALYKQYFLYQSNFDLSVDDDYDIYKIKFPYLTIDISTLHELIFNMNMKNKIIQLKYII